MVEFFFWVFQTASANHYLTCLAGIALFLLGDWFLTTMADRNRRK